VGVVTEERDPLTELFLHPPLCALVTTTLPNPPWKLPTGEQTRVRRKYEKMNPEKVLDDSVKCLPPLVQIIYNIDILKL